MVLVEDAAESVASSDVEPVSFDVRDEQTGRPLTTGFYYDRIPTHRDVPDIEVVFIESDDGLGPYGAKSVGESGKALSPAAIANAVSNAIGRRMKDLPITRDRILGALA